MAELNGAAMEGPEILVTYWILGALLIGTGLVCTSLVVASWLHLRGLQRAGALLARHSIAVAPWPVQTVITHSAAGSLGSHSGTFHLNDFPEALEPGASQQAGPVPPRRPEPQASEMESGSHEVAGQPPDAPLLKKAEQQMKEGQWAAALDEIDRVKRFHPADPRVHLKRATCLEKLNRVDEALQSYTEAFQADPTRTAALLCKGNLLNTLGRRQEALECYNQALGRTPLKTTSSPSLAREPVS